jgi:ABC-type Na+ efflux pump permease subunit
MTLWQSATVIAPSAHLAVLAALYGVLGTGLGLLLRNTAAVGLALMWAFVVEGILPVLTHPPGMIRWLPEATANAVLHGASATATSLPPGAALAVLTGYAAALAIGGAIVTTRREIGTATG